MQREAECDLAFFELFEGTLAGIVSGDGARWGSAAEHAGRRLRGRGQMMARSGAVGGDGPGPKRTGDA